jgi:hypothetical protein
MAEKEPVPEADALDQARPLAEVETIEPEEIPPDVPEGDALDQARPLTEAADSKVRLRADVPEADALEQIRPVAEDDDDDWR